MITEADRGWWTFSLDPAERSDPARNLLRGKLTISRRIVDGGRLDYATYLRLDQLLQAQAPVSTVPDERAFITTHQLIELVFKQMVFDLAVVAQTMVVLISVTGSADFLRLCTGAGHSPETDFWAPALTASARLRLSGELVLPLLLTYLADDETFSADEFTVFRPHLARASGFQTAQFRLIQRALGKANLLAIRVFPGEAFVAGHQPKPVAYLPVLERVILGDMADVASPPDSAPWSIVASLDDLAHRVLGSLPGLDHAALVVRPVPTITDGDIKKSAAAFETMLTRQRRVEAGVAWPPSLTGSDRKAIAEFVSDLRNAVQLENHRRAELSAARTGASYLHYMAPAGHLATVLDRLVRLDEALHGRYGRSFLVDHLALARKRAAQVQSRTRALGAKEQPSGTAGGGPAYLRFVLADLIPFFPSLIAYRDLEEIQAFSWVEA